MHPFRGPVRRGHPIHDSLTVVIRIHNSFTVIV
jgi:hypothetical protein